MASFFLIIKANWHFLLKLAFTLLQKHMPLSMLFFHLAPKLPPPKTFKLAPIFNHLLEPLLFICLKSLSSCFFTTHSHELLLRSDFWTLRRWFCAKNRSRVWICWGLLLSHRTPATGSPFFWAQLSHFKIRYPFHGKFPSNYTKTFQIIPKLLIFILFHSFQSEIKANKSEKGEWYGGVGRLEGWENGV